MSRGEKTWQLCASSFPRCYFFPRLVNHAKTITQNTVSLLPITRMNQFVLIVWFLATWLVACNQLVKVLTIILPTRLANWTTTPNIISPSILWRNQPPCTLKTATLVSCLQETFLFFTLRSRHFSAFIRLAVSAVYLGSLRNDNATTQWLDWLKNNRAARAARFLVQLFDVVCQTTTSELHIWGSDDNASE